MERYLFDMVNILKEKHEISLFLPSKYNVSFKGIKIYHYYQIHIPFLESLSLLISILVTLPHILIKNRYDIVSIFIPSFGSFITLLISKLFKIKTIMNLRNAWESGKYVSIFLSGLSFLFCDIIVMNAKSLLVDYQDKILLPKSIIRKIPSFYLPNAIDSDFWSPSEKVLDKKYDIVYIANLHSDDRIYKKGFLNLCYTINLLIKRHHFYPKVLMIGEYSEKLIKRYILSLKDDIFYWKGYVRTSSELKLLIQSARLFVLSSNVEGMPNSLLQASLLEICCVSTNVGSAENIIKNEYSGVIVERQNPDRLAESIISLLTHPEKIAYFSKNGRKLVKSKFNWKDNLKSLELLFNSLIH